MTLLGPDDGVTAERLRTERVLWLGTVDVRARPHMVPMWFHWRDPEVLMFAGPDTAKVARLRGNPAVAVALDTAAGGADAVLGEGTARIVPMAEVDPAPFGAKYAHLLGEQSFEEWLRDFAVPVVITLDKIVSWGPDRAYRSLR
jgi:PPOX class probable F420-dependent enzyme